MKDYLQRFRNTGTVIALAGTIGLLLNQFGFNIDIEWLDNTIKLVCTIAVLLGVCNDPTTNGVDLPKK